MVMVVHTSPIAAIADVLIAHSNGTGICASCLLCSTAPCHGQLDTMHSGKIQSSGSNE